MTTRDNPPLLSDAERAVEAGRLGQGSTSPKTWGMLPSKAGEELEFQIPSVGIGLGFRLSSFNAAGVGTGCLATSSLGERTLSDVRVKRPAGNSSTTKGSRDHGAQELASKFTRRVGKLRTSIVDG